MDINYSEKDNEYIDELCEFLEKESEAIVSFFKLYEFGDKIDVTLFDDLNKFRDVVKKIYSAMKKDNINIPDWLCGLSYDKKYIITLYIHYPFQNN